MKRVEWSLENLVACRGAPGAEIANMVVVAERGEQVRVQIERSEFRPILGRLDHGAASRARFRQGCIKVVEESIWPLPQRGRVLAEIHRRLDQVPDSDCLSADCRSGLASIYDFAGAWALVAQLMRAGLQVSATEGEAEIKRSNDEGRADVEIIIPTSPAQVA